MTEADKPQFAAALAELALLRPAGLKLTDAHFAAWWSLMRHDWTLDEFRRACATLALSCEDVVIGPQHFAQLRRKAAEQSGGEAWERVLETIRTMYVREGASIDPKTDAVVRQLGGYGHLAMMPSEDLKFRAREFQQLWQEMGEVETARAALPSVAPSKRLSGPQRATVPQLGRAQ